MELKQLRHLKADGTLPEQQQQAAAEGIAAEGDSDSAARDTKARHSKHEQHQHAQARAQQQHQQIQQQVERNLGMQTREEDDVDLLQHLIEHGITQHGLLGGPYKRLILLGAFDPLKLVQRLGQQIPANDEKDSAAAAALLQQAAVLSLSKYAAVSKTFCDELLGPQTTTLHALISLLFAKEGRPELGAPREGAPRGGPPTPLEGPRTRLPKDVEPPGLKDAILVCFGDLTCRHPNALEPYNDYVFSLLREGAVSGQLTAVHVLTHLTMTGMIKPKGRLLVNMLLLQLQYPQQQDQPPRDRRVEEAARTFFFEVDRKDPLAVLTALPELLTALAIATAAPDSSSPPPQGAAAAAAAAGSSAHVAAAEGPVATGRRQDRERLLAFILEFTKGRRQSEALIDKICIRVSSLASAGSPSQGQPLSLEDGSSDSLDALFGTQGGGGALWPLGAPGPRAVTLQGASQEALSSCLFVYLGALSALVLGAPNITKALQRLCGCWHLLRTSVGASEAAATQLRDLCKKAAMKAANKNKAGTSATGKAAFSLPARWVKKSVSALKSVTEELLLKIAAARGYSDAEGVS
ncbi:uncharacterized protein LOC34619808 [Cyclospora cayetanensis]|uniref:Uncharacterized protein LOC34619808 n=1 Tax=Cyclospora cayetanensis TaxID=88456 RepID=A0A6P6RPE2_9EIME|nr:uncharacterized protein LOC34619808 [Cyclospora cayetanensis]